MKIKKRILGWIIVIGIFIIGYGISYLVHGKQKVDCLKLAKDYQACQVKLLTSKKNYLILKKDNLEDMAEIMESLVRLSGEEVDREDEAIKNIEIANINFKLKELQRLENEMRAKGYVFDKN